MPMLACVLIRSSTSSIPATPQSRISVHLRQLRLDRSRRTGCIFLQACVCVCASLSANVLFTWIAVHLETIWYIFRAVQKKKKNGGARVNMTLAPKKKKNEARFNLPHERTYQRWPGAHVQNLKVIRVLQNAFYA